MFTFVRGHMLLGDILRLGSGVTDWFEEFVSSYFQYAGSEKVLSELITVEQPCEFGPLQPAVATSLARFTSNVPLLTSRCTHVTRASVPSLHGFFGEAVDFLEPQLDVCMPEEESSPFKMSSEPRYATAEYELPDESTDMALK